ncbi:MAG: hypothetical protein ACI9MS_000211 [Glaciecola sp.]
MTDVNQQASVYCVLRVDPLTGFAEPDGVPTALVRYLNGVVVDVLLDGSDNFFTNPKFLTSGSLSNLLLIYNTISNEFEPIFAVTSEYIAIATAIRDLVIPSG